jgi:hypothetical protein
LGLDEAEKPAKAKGFLSPSETRGFATLVVSRWNHWGSEIGHLARLFVFNDLTRCSFRMNRKRHPGPMKRRAGLAVNSEKQ